MTEPMRAELSFPDMPSQSGGARMFDATGRPLVPCAAQPEWAKGEWPKSWKLRRRPKCNRVAGHDGPHREIHRSSFSVRAEWT